MNPVFLFLIGVVVVDSNGFFISKVQLDETSAQNTSFYTELRDNKLVETVQDLIYSLLNTKVGQTNNDLINEVGANEEPDRIPSLVRVRRHALSRLSDEDVQVAIDHVKGLNERLVLKSGQSNVMNALVDSALEVVDRMVEATYPIPPVIQKFSQRYHFVKLKGEFRGEDGYLKNLTTLQRKGNCSLDQDNDILMASFILGFRELGIHFDKYQLNVLKIRLHGKLDVHVKENAALFQIGVLLNDTQCSIEIVKFKMISFDKIKVHVTGGGLFQWIINKIANIVARRVQNDVKKEVERKINIKLAMILRAYESQLCSLFRKVKEKD